MLRRELAIAFRSWGTWLGAASAALLIGHGFILAIDLYSASSRSALAGTLQNREMEPLGGIVRPTLGGLDLSLSLLVPLVAARALSRDKERGALGVRCLEAGSINAVILAKWGASVFAAALFLVPVLLLLVAFVAVGGHLDPWETAVAICGQGLHLLLVATVAIAAAATVPSLAQAATLAIVISLSSWAIDAGDGFAALAWLGGAEAWSIDRHLVGFGRGILAVGPLVWVATASGGALALALVAARFDWTWQRRAAAALGMSAAAAMMMSSANGWRRAYDWTEGRRLSLPPDAARGLSSLEGPIAIEILLDRDDSRRQQLEADTLTKLKLARPDVRVSFPLDAQSERAAAQRDEDYGRVTIRVNAAVRSTRSTSRRELISLVFDAAGQSLPEWRALTYPGYPVVVSGKARALLGAQAYGILPFSFLALGLLSTRRRAPW